MKKMRMALRLRRSRWLHNPAIYLAGGIACLIAGLAAYDYWHIGTIDHPCAAQRGWHADIALVLSGAPALRRTRQAVAAFKAGHVARVAFTGAGNGGDSARHLARGAERQLGLAREAIVIEDQARSTADNFRLSCRLSALADAHTIAIATDAPHMWRSLKTAEAQCPTRQFCALPAPLPLTDKRRRSETLKLLAYQLSGRADWF